MEASMRRKAAGGLLAVTFAWGATFIWMKQAMNAIQPEIEAVGRTPIVAALVGGRFLIAFLALYAISKEARSALYNPQLLKGGAILGGARRATESCSAPSEVRGLTAVSSSCYSGS